MKKIATVLNPSRHVEECTYEKTDWYCLKCGEKEVWVEAGDGDFYEGPDYVCTSCHTMFHAPTIELSNQEENCEIMQISKQLLQSEQK